LDQALRLFWSRLALAGLAGVVLALLGL
jgi:hypothetical protein